jgi:FkbM family methyltransferase
MISITTIKKRLANSSKNCRLSAGQINFFKAIGANNTTKYFGTRGRYTVQLPHGGAFCMHSSNSISDNRLMRLGLFYNEKVSKQLWLELCQKAETVADVGANVGQFVLMALAANPKLTVHAFEPLPQNLETMSQNLAANLGFGQNVTIHKIALSYKKGVETLYFQEGNIYTPTLRSGGGTRTSSVSVATETMDAVLTSPIDLVKMDIEGGEPFVIRGMNRILAENGPLILIEVLSNEAGAELDALMKPFDYAYFFIDETSGLVPSATIDRRHPHSHNFLLVPRTKLHMVPAQLMA